MELGLRFEGRSSRRETKTLLLFWFEPPYPDPGTAAEFETIPPALVLPHQGGPSHSSGRYDSQVGRGNMTVCLSLNLIFLT